MNLHDLGARLVAGSILDDQPVADRHARRPVGVERDRPGRRIPAGDLRRDRVVPVERGGRRAVGRDQDLDVRRLRERLEDAEVGALGGEGRLLWHGDATVGDVDAVVVPGGFAHGDYLRPGAIARFSPVMSAVADFAAAGGPVVGICNGFQVLVEAGVLPTGNIDPSSKKQLSLIHNQSAKFECRWPQVEVGKSACKYITVEYEGTTQSLPVANGEGRLVAPGLIIPDSQVVLKYVGPDGGAASYPDDPNGSLGGITAICDPSGVVLGMMPHPERAIITEQHEGWRRGNGQNPFGAVIFRGIVDHARSI